MKARLGGMRLAALASLTVLCAIAAPAVASAAETDLELYSATVDEAELGTLTVGGYDIAATAPAGAATKVDLVLSAGERAELEREGIEVELVRDPQGRTASERAAAQARGGFDVWRDYDGRDGIARELRRIVRNHPEIAQLHELGKTHQGRNILAVRLTRNPDANPVGSRPSVLYQGTTHAREWISTEVTRRLLRHFVNGSDSSDAIRRMLHKRELWFVPVLNPDGYQYTFEEERLWRKNLRDNNNDGNITIGDGVDLNRNYPEHWRYEDEGSSSEPSSETYRGPSAASEPETQADIGLVERVPFSFALTYHSYGRLLLYPEGWQVQTPSRDDPIYQALTGTDADPAVPGFDPDLAAELYTVNGDFTDFAHGEEDTLAWTPELAQGCRGCGFVFPDNEERVQKEFEDNLPFALDLVRSARRPAKPHSHLGNTTEAFYLETVSGDETRAHNPGSDFRFSLSYGDPQLVEVLAKRSLGDVEVHYRINDGAEQTAPTSEWNGGETYGQKHDVYYHQLRGAVSETDPGDEVKVWFEGGGKRSESFTYTAVSESGAQALIVAAEDYTGISNDPPYRGAGPSFLPYFEDALDANGISYEIYDIDGEGRQAPDDLGVLSHFDAAVWYTGNDVITREVDQLPGTASRLANDGMLEMRSYLNEGGKLLYNGQFAGLQYAFAYPFDPVSNAPCAAGDPEVDARCQPLSDDFLQYDLGAYIYNDDAGTDPNGDPYPVNGIQDPYAGIDWTLNGPRSAKNQIHTASFLSTSSLLDESVYPQFASDVPAEWDSGGAAAQPFEPYDGERYMYSDRADITYKRLTRTIDLTGVSAGDAPNLTFRTSYDTELDWDYMLVEAHTEGADDWTTLPDVNGHTSQDTGLSCPEGWIADLHPFLAHYQTRNDDGSCEPTGTTGEWNASSGRSDGWEQWQVDLSDYAGEQVEISIAYVSDYSLQGLGSFVDQIETSTGEGTTSFEDDASPMDGWTVSGSPPGSGDNPNDWYRTGSVGFEEGAVVSTDDTLYFGFGFEGIRGPGRRADVMGRSMDYLLGP